MLEKNRDNIAKALPGLAKYELTQGEAVSSGFYYNAFVPNLDTSTAPAAVPGLRVRIPARCDAGQPPDNAGPRAEFPWPLNGIPQEDRR